MGFYERYEKLCTDRNIKPISKQAGDMIGVSRATISVWKKNGLAPKAETVAVIADVYGVSMDYLMGRTNDPTDYADPALIADVAGPVLDALDGDVKKAVAVQRATAEDVKREQDMPPIFRKYATLDETDKAKVGAYIDGLLTHEKYNVVSTVERKKQA